MKALVLHGKNEAFRHEEIADPTPGPGESIVNVRAAALNHRDLWIQKGQYAGLKFPIVVGSDGCGVVEEVGPGGDAALTGQEVIINPGLGWGESAAAQDAKFSILGLPSDGTLAEKVKVPTDHIVAKPAHLTAEQAAALPLAGLTAWRALMSRAALNPGEKVLVTGVGGGVALIALQLAVAHVCPAWVTSSSDEKLRRALTLGARGGANYKGENWVKELKEMSGGGFDVIVDSAGGPGFGKLVDLASPGGRIVFFGATLGNPPEIDLRRIFWKQVSLLGTTMGSPAEFAAMTKFVGEKKIVPVVSHTFTLEQGNDAFAEMDRGGQFGKIVVKP